MVQSYGLPRCPHCMSLNVEPKGKTWHCNDCGKDSDQVMVEEAPPEPPKKTGKGEDK